MKELSEIQGFESCSGYYIYEDGRFYSDFTNKFLKGSIDSKGYRYVDLRGRDPIIRNPKIHRLVMLAFSEEEPKEQINHIDGDKLNNHLDNLEWATNRENREHAIRTGLKDEIPYGVGQYDLDGNLLNVYDTAGEAMGAIGKNPLAGGDIGRAIRGVVKTAYGYVWKSI